jgi:hypothetical protein
MGYREMFGAAEDDPIHFAADAEQPRLYFAPEVINQELCRLLGSKSYTAPPRASASIRLEQSVACIPIPSRGYEWPIK